MFKTIINTIFSKLAIAVITFVMSIMVTRLLGDDVRGQVGITMATLTFTLHLVGFVAGSSLVYLASRKNMYRLLRFSLLWSFLVCGILSVCTSYFPSLSVIKGFEFFALSFGHALLSTFIHLVVGIKKVRAQNFATLLQSFILIASFYVIYTFVNSPSIYIWYQAQLISVGVGSTICLFVLLKNATNNSEKPTLFQVFSFGSLNQSSNVVQFFNYRLSFYFISWLLVDGEKQLSLLANAMIFVEGIWVLSRSLGLVNYAETSNSSNKDREIRYTNYLLKISLLSNTAITAVLLLIPGELFDWVFGGVKANVDYSGIKDLLLLLSVGIVSNGITMMCSNYFSGKGKFQFNLVQTGISLLIGAPLTYYLIPVMGLSGAAIGFSGSMFAGMLYSVFRYIEFTNQAWTSLIVRKNDLTLFLDRFKLKSN